MVYEKDWILKGYSLALHLHVTNTESTMVQNGSGLQCNDIQRTALNKLNAKFTYITARGVIVFESFIASLSK